MSAAHIFAHQGKHVAGLGSLLLALGAVSPVPGFWAGSFLGLSTRTWVHLVVAAAVVHQTYVWICWRLQLEAGFLTRRLGHAAFPLYAAGFESLILARAVLIAGLSVSNARSLPASPALLLSLATAAAAPALYALYSVARYFGFKRAMGADHFEDRYRSMPLVREGIFRYTRNGMYTFGFLAYWVPGLALGSVAAIAAAAFCHAYIWVHYFVTEKPDMERIYGGAIRAL